MDRKTDHPRAIFAGAGLEHANKAYAEGDTIFSQGGACDSIFFLEGGRVKMTVTSEQGREAVVAILDAPAFFGESCLTGHELRSTTAHALTNVTTLRVDKDNLLRSMAQSQALSEYLLAYVLRRAARVEEDLIDQLFNSSEKRLARTLLLLANFGKEGRDEIVLGKVDQTTLAEMIGTTRSRVSYFMNKFRKLGLIEYNGKLTVKSALLNVLLHDKIANDDRNAPHEEEA